ncbi:unnamed protein product [Prunus armeniaca]
MNFLWLLAVVVVIGIGVNGGVGHEDCRETRCRPDGPAIRFPFRLKGRQPIHCGFRGFDLSCTEYNETMLEMASSTKLLVDDINYRSHAIRGRAYDGCLPRELFYRNGSYPFQFIGRTPLFSCPPSTVRDKYGCGYGCLVRLNPCHGNNSAVSNSAVSSALIREELRAQHSVFYTSKALLDAETSYPKLEKLILALVVFSRKL